MDSVILKDFWYFAFHGDELKPGELQQKQIAGEKIVFGRGRDGTPFALRDNCPHRGVPLSDGTFDGDTIQCCYHGWKFETSGACCAIPALADAKFELSKIKALSYPCREISRTIWIYISSQKLGPHDPLPPLPDLLVSADKAFLPVQTVLMPTNIDHATVGLIDPAHVTFVHQSWFWRSSKNTKLKEKNFEPFERGFRMKRHQPSTNSKGYSILKGGTSTEINFQLPGHRFEHILVGEKHEIISITLLTPLDENTTELNHILYTTLDFVRWFWWPLRALGRDFICQDVHVFRKLACGLESDPPLMLIGDPDTQARWYFELKKQWRLAQETHTEFVNTTKPATLHWVT